MKNIVATIASVLATAAVLGTMLAFPPALGTAEAPASAAASVVAVD